MSYYSLSFYSAPHEPAPVSIIRVDPAETTAPRKAVEVLRSGGLLAFPTTEGYVVGCSAIDPEAVRRLCVATGAAPETLQRLDDSRDPIPVTLMRDADTPIVATPPRPGAPPVPTAQHVVFILGDKVDVVLDAGPVHRRAPVAAR
ncbi:MAG: hypothetical protein ACT4PY_06215 [Armatimonadota bacterium]